MLKFKQYLAEQELKSHLDDFLQFCGQELNITELPELEIMDSKETAKERKSFGGYSPATNKIELNVAGRHTADILRTLGHELVHHKQNMDGVLHDKSGETGSEHENEANSMAGVLLRNYGRANPGIYEEVEH
jgi:hypothetical protein